MNPVRLRLWKPASWPSASSHATAGIASSDSRNRYQGGNAKLGHYLKIAAGFRKRFGSEYRAVIEHGSEGKAEAKQADRETGRGNLKIRTLTAAKRGRFSADRQFASRLTRHALCHNSQSRCISKR